ncbi:hypothetical protein FUAX_55410 (plasmid) [Fulvitalea axinellae]|uniref:HTH cro/C1-type domain-containing protein n=1 Tax=Fulvitalea axinellae TaxID=1182444 RepID=A0AAU9CMG9_9BACT|nr:hypothetical protein FUAX_55410 [Fulvitalea axinellae]
MTDNRPKATEQDWKIFDAVMKIRRKQNPGPEETAFLKTVELKNEMALYIAEGTYNESCAFAKLLDRFREALGANQAVFAKKLGYRSPSTITNIKNGRSASEELCFALAKLSGGIIGPELWMRVAQIENLHHLNTHKDHYQSRLKAVIPAVSLPASA